MKKSNTKTKRVLAIFLAVMMCLSMLNLTAFADDVEGNLAETTPAVTAEAATTETPSTTETPTTTEIPATAEKPAETEVPATTEKPTETEAPATTEKPAVTETPSTSEIPATTEAPITTEESGKTETPVPAETPADTAQKETVKPVKKGVKAVVEAIEDNEDESTIVYKEFDFLQEFFFWDEETNTNQIFPVPSGVQFDYTISCGSEPVITGTFVTQGNGSDIIETLQIPNVPIDRSKKNPTHVTIKTTGLEKFKNYELYNYYVQDCYSGSWEILTDIYHNPKQEISFDIGWDNLHDADNPTKYPDGKWGYVQALLYAYYDKVGDDIPEPIPSSDPDKNPDQLKTIQRVRIPTAPTDWCVNGVFQSEIAPITIESIHCEYTLLGESYSVDSFDEHHEESGLIPTDFQSMDIWTENAGEVTGDGHHSDPPVPVTLTFTLSEGLSPDYQYKLELGEIVGNASVRSELFTCNDRTVTINYLVPVGSDFSGSGAYWDHSLDSPDRPSSWAYVMERLSLIAVNHAVKYQWSGLPEGTTDPALPEDVRYAKDTEVTVDGRTANSTVTVNGRTYIFSGWSTEDATVEGSKFTMPAKDVVIKGEWTEKTYNVSYFWSGLPENHGQILPTDGNQYKQGAEVTVDTKFTNTSTVAINGRTYTFSGWSTEDAIIEDGKFAMPAKDVVIRGTWTDTTPAPVPPSVIILPTPTPTPTATPTPTPEPTEEPSPTPEPTDEPIEDPDVPLGTPKPTEEPTPGPSATPDPGDEPIEDPDVPLGTPKPAPTANPTPVPDEEIPDEDVPKGNVPKTGDDSAVWFLLTLVSGAGLVFLGAGQWRKRKGA